jgi:hypothetical protein
MRDLKFRTKDPQSLGTAVQNVVPRTKRLTAFVRHWLQPAFLNYFLSSWPFVPTQIETLYTPLVWGRSYIRVVYYYTQKNRYFLCKILFMSCTDKWVKKIFFVPSWTAFYSVWHRSLCPRPPLTYCVWVLLRPPVQNCWFILLQIQGFELRHSEHYRESEPTQTSSSLARRHIMNNLYIYLGD